MMRKHSSHIEAGSSSCCSGTCYCSKKVKVTICVVIWTVIAVIVALILAVIIKAATLQELFERMELGARDDPVFMSATEQEILERSQRLVDAISYRTISFSGTNLSLEAMTDFGTFLERVFPNLHDSDFVTFTPINTYSRLYRIEGTEKTLNPYLLCAHMDVVPEGDFDLWTHDPFDAGIVTESDGQDYIFGRGAIDDKHAVLGIMEALEYKVVNKEQPKRTFYIGFGHDEEVSGYLGAAEISITLEKMLKDNGEELDFLLDEGMFVVADIIPGINVPLIYIGVAEKGWAVVDLDAEGDQVHSSTPPLESSIGILAHGVANMEDNKQPSMFGKGPEIDTLRYAAPHATFLLKMILGNLWLFSGLVSSALELSSQTDSIQRTTTAVTIFNAGVKENVVPSQAHAVVNHRIHPSDNLEDVLELDRENADRVKVTLRDSFPPSEVSSYSNDVIPFQIVVNSALEVFPDAKPVPGLMVANTDTFHYKNLTDKIYRFTPVYNLPEDIARFHGIDERISVDIYSKVVQFYYRLMVNADFDVKIAPTAQVEVKPEEVEEFLEILEESDYESPINNTDSNLLPLTKVMEESDENSANETDSHLMILQDIPEEPNENPSNETDSGLPPSQDILEEDFDAMPVNETYSDMLPLESAPKDLDLYDLTPEEETFSNRTID
ncbi:hypothetical protein TCAL_00447 [Tigriopus californicus]|uniref:Peptidase M20 dimerisation domain-containing protein n=1 Tax=Tigriopus californicus TaxID=6832 RepID=A0A553NFE2_TIGCA|nr:N-fatty-acyl-amino acid synthase/hydrolase PM20D1.2-like [Tigriopus californicus]XP_059092357.1 N-fatty-acyl-amino acid synthase/hydrolase PM20D1.2-like [Tigriopus californicus]TRY64118.1 hypothetical protein TCAL_00447 [Tigriopus californicus]|eukprot:TCALIF_00447-PA protein Name:"Similar to pm20d1.2 Probable carboxypeptidase PM20D1.2 (Danio rerio)" AED:0.10 eAED:0.10 QI:0/-1/0/1/-1/1/1/0/667